MKNEIRDKKRNREAIYAQFVSREKDRVIQTKPRKGGGTKVQRPKRSGVETLRPWGSCFIDQKTTIRRAVHVLNG